MLWQELKQVYEYGIYNVSNTFIQQACYGKN